MPTESGKPFTQTQGQYLAFIHYYTRLNRVAPAESDFQRYFDTTPPTIHSMILRLEKLGLIERTPRMPRSIKLLVPPETLPLLE